MPSCLTSSPCCAADSYLTNDKRSIEQSIVNHLEYTLARNRYKVDNQEAYSATALSLRDRLIESWNDTQQHFKWVCHTAASCNGRCAQPQL